MVSSIKQLKIALISFSDADQPGRCEHPGTPDHAVTQASDQTLGTNSVLHFACEPGYSLRGRAQITCMNDNQWDGDIPRCERIQQDDDCR